MYLFFGVFLVESVTLRFISCKESNNLLGPLLFFISVTDGW